MKFQEGDIVKTKVERGGYPIGTKGVIVHVSPHQDAGVVEIWNRADYPIDTVDYRFADLELVLREND